MLRRGGFFGPNAAGKSSFIKSIAFARDFIVDGQKSGKGIRIDQFKLEKDDIYQFEQYPEDEFWIVTDVNKNWSCVKI